MQPLSCLSLNKALGQCVLRRVDVVVVSQLMYVILYTLGADGTQTLFDNVTFLYRVYTYSNDEMLLFGLFVMWLLNAVWC